MRSDGPQKQVKICAHTLNPSIYSYPSISMGFGQWSAYWAELQDFRKLGSQRRRCLTIELRRLENHKAYMVKLSHSTKKDGSRKMIGVWDLDMVHKTMYQTTKGILHCQGRVKIPTMANGMLQCKHGLHRIWPYHPVRYFRWMSWTLNGFGARTIKFQASREPLQLYNVQPHPIQICWRRWW